MASTMRIVLYGPEGEELFSGYSVSTVPPPLPAAADADAEREDPSSSGIYLAAILTANATVKS